MNEYPYKSDANTPPGVDPKSDTPEPHVEPDKPYEQQPRDFGDPAVDPNKNA
jgi:hypothetical protein